MSNPTRLQIIRNWIILLSILGLIAYVGHGLAFGGLLGGSAASADAYEVSESVNGELVVTFVDADAADSIVIDARTEIYELTAEGESVVIAPSIPDITVSAVKDDTVYEATHNSTKPSFEVTPTHATLLVEDNLTIDAAATDDATHEYSFDASAGDIETNGESATVSFEMPGDEYITVKATNDNRTSIITVPITVTANPPEIDLDAPETTPVGDNTTFTANVSYGAGAITHAWAIDGEPVENATESTLDYEFENTGEYEVNVTVEDALGETDSQAATVTVYDTPVAVAGDNETSYVTEEVTLDGSESSDPLGDDLTYEWVVDGETYDGETVDLTFDEEGTYEATLTVENPYGETATDSLTITVTSRTPVAAAGNDKHGSVGDTFTFDASDSYDPDGSDLTYEWEFGDGTTSTSVAPRHSYGSSGVYQVTVTVTDAYGNVDSDSLSVTVQPDDNA